MPGARGLWRLASTPRGLWRLASAPAHPARIRRRQLPSRDMWQATLNMTDGTGQSRVTHGSSMSDIGRTHTVSNADLPAETVVSGGVVSMVCSEQRPLLAGDVKVTIFGAKGKMAAFWFHTAFIEDGKLRLSKGELDKACKEKKLYRDDFGVEVRRALVGGGARPPRRHGREGWCWGGRMVGQRWQGLRPYARAAAHRLRRRPAGRVRVAGGGIEGELSDTIGDDAFDWLAPMSHLSVRVGHRSGRVAMGALPSTLPRAGPIFDGGSASLVPSESHRIREPD